MAQQKGNIGITTENIFPVIKKFLYSDHEIFLREIVANAIDATQKLKTLAAKGENVGDTENLTIEVKVDAEAGTLTVSDRGIGMTAEEIDRYINQIAFSGATDFLEKYNHHRTLRTRILQFVYGIQACRHHHQELEGLTCTQVELRRQPRIHPRGG